MSQKTFSTATNTSVTVGTANTEVLSSSANRRYVSITNLSSDTVYLAFDDNAALNSGKPLFANGTLEMSDDGIFVGQINAIANSAGNVLAITYNQ